MYITVRISIGFKLSGKDMDVLLVHRSVKVLYKFNICSFLQYKPYFAIGREEIVPDIEATATGVSIRRGQTDFGATRGHRSRLSRKV